MFIFFPLFRWDDNCIEGLPNYMKVYYEALLDIFKGIEKDISKDDIPNHAIHYAKKAVYIFSLTLLLSQ